MIITAEKCPSKARQKSKKCKKSTAAIPTVTEETEETDDTLDGEALICTNCGSIITFSSERVDINGAFNHSFANPHGLFFEISCFKNAPGCICSNESSSEFTWFPGFSWRVAACQSCLNHLGWLFSSAKNHFYGLISANLTTAKTSED